jgi:hypothetical protein
MFYLIRWQWMPAYEMRNEPNAEGNAETRPASSILRLYIHNGEARRHRPVIASGSGGSQAISARDVSTPRAAAACGMGCMTVIAANCAAVGCSSLGHCTQTSLATTTDKFNGQTIDCPTKTRRIKYSGIPWLRCVRQGCLEAQPVQLLQLHTARKTRSDFETGAEERCVSDSMRCTRTCGITTITTTIVIIIIIIIIIIITTSTTTNHSPSTIGIAKRRLDLRRQLHFLKFKLISSQRCRQTKENSA